MDRASTEQLVRLDTLLPHPQNSDLYKDDQRSEQEESTLLDSIKLYGLWNGHLIIHEQTKTILHGHRRVTLAKQLGISEAVVKMVSHLPDDIDDPEVLQFLLNGNAQREKTNVEKLREFELRKEVESKLAARRSEAGKSLEAPLGPQGPVVETGRARDIAARKAGLTTATKGGKKAEEALKALKIADKLQDSAPEKARAIKAALNQAPGAGVRVAKQLTAEPVATPSKAFTLSITPRGQKTEPEPKSDGKRIRNLHRCKQLDGYLAELEYFKAEMPKLIEKVNAAKRHMHKLGDHLTDEFVKDRTYAEFMTVWSVAWKEEEGFDFVSQLDELQAALSALGGLHIGFRRHAFTDEVTISREAV